MFRDLEAPENRSTLEFSNATNKNIREVIHKNFPRAVKQTKSFAARFRADTPIKTAYNVWKFLKEHIRYSKDDEGEQLVRLPSRFVTDCTGDCKSYSLTAASLLFNLGLPVSFRYAGYDGATIPTHVYVVTRDNDGKEIIVDGVWKYFNSEKKPTLKFDEQMEVKTLSGIDGIGRRRKGGFFKKFTHLNKKAALVIPRRSFLTLVALNMFGFARKIYSMNQKHPGHIKKLWVDRLGGNYKHLMKSTKIGYNRWLKRHHKPAIHGISLEQCCAGIGIAPAVAAYVTAAAGIIPVFASAFKKGGVKELPGEASGEETIDAAQEAAAANPGAADTIEGINRRFNVKRFVRHQRARNRHIRESLHGLGKARRKRKGLLKKLVRGTKKISLAPNRQAFRTMVSMNVGGLALKLARVNNSSDKNELKKRWEKIGGKYADLVKSMRTGMKRVPAKSRVAISAAEQTSASGWAALASSVLKLFSGLFRKHEKKTATGDAPPGETTFDKIVDVAQKAATAAGESSQPADELIDEGKADAGADESDEPTTAGFSLSGKGLLYGGLALGTLALISSKSKK